MEVENCCSRLVPLNNTLCYLSRRRLLPEHTKAVLVHNNHGRVFRRCLHHPLTLILVLRDADLTLALSTENDDSLARPSRAYGMQELGRDLEVDRWILDKLAFALLRVRQRRREAKALAVVLAALEPSRGSSWSARRSHFDDDVAEIESPVPYNLCRKLFSSFCFHLMYLLA